MKAIIAIDIGTSGCKVLAVDEKCRLIGSVTNEYAIYYPEVNWTEQNPSDWWNAAASGTKELMKSLAGYEIAGVGLSGQMHGMVALDKNNNVIRPAILWNDQRTKKQCEELINFAGGLDNLLQLTNNPMLTGFTAGKILWMKENEPENYSKTVKIINPKDYISFLLTGKLTTDVSDASGTGLYDVKNNRWSAELISAAGLDSSFFATPAASSDIIGTVTESAAGLTGIPAGTPVCAGGGDAVLSTISMGAGDNESAAIMVGTSGVVSVHSENFFENTGAKVQFSRACINDMYHVMGVTLAAAGSYKWFGENFGENDYKAMDALAETSAPGAGGVLFLPYLYGERCPVNDPEASASFTGIRASSTKADFTRAVLEGVAFSLKQVFELIQGNKTYKKIYIAGGGAKSPLWRQIFADVFGLETITAEGSGEGSGFGAAVVAGVGIGMFEDAGAAAAMLNIKSVNKPIRENVAVYQLQYEKYCKLYDKLK